MKDLEKLIQLGTPIKCGNRNLTHIKVKVEHDKGGLYWGTGEIHESGVITRVTPLEVQEMEIEGHKYNIYGQIIDGNIEHMGFYVFCLPCKRKSPKKLEKVANAVFPLSQDIVDKFIEGNYTACANMIVNASKNVK